MAYEDFKDLPRRTACDKVLGDRAFNTAQNSKCDEYQRGLHQSFTKFLLKNLVLHLQINLQVLLLTQEYEFEN